MITLTDIVFPEPPFEGRLLASWIIFVGLAVELQFVRLLTGFTLKRWVVADLAVNAVSTAAGLLLIPILGLGWGARRLSSSWTEQI